MGSCIIVVSRHASMTVKRKIYKHTKCHLIQHFIQYHANTSNIIQEKNIIQTQGYLIDHLKSNVKLSP